MKAVTNEIKADYREKGSKFIGMLFPVYSKAAFEKRLKEMKKEYHDASHHCYAWRINPHHKKEFVQDDGEPGGTAGLPILNQLKSFEVINATCVVVRYFGGTELGKSGLINAYGYTAKRCLQKAPLKKLIRTQKVKVTYPYSQQKQINRLKNSFDLKETDARYLEEVTIEIACRLKQAQLFWDQLIRLEHLGIEVEKGDKSYIVLND